MIYGPTRSECAMPCPADEASSHLAACRTDFHAGLFLLREGWLALMIRSHSQFGAEGDYPLDVPGHGHEAPFVADIFEAAEQELAESEHGFEVGIMNLMPTLA